MMRRRDPIFWTATGIFLVALVLARTVDNRFLLLMIGAYLLRPTLHSLGFARALIDERQMQIQYRASNVGFTALVIGNIVAGCIAIALAARLTPPNWAESSSIGSAATSPFSRASSKRATGLSSTRPQRSFPTAEPHGGAA